MREIRRAALTDSELIGRINRHRLLGPLKRFGVGHFRRQLERVRGDRMPEVAPLRAPAIPPPWLTEVFGPTRTRFSNAKLKALGWSPRIDLAEGQRRTVRWLEDAGILRPAGDADR